ncbi:MULTISPECIES: phosphopantetheine-binding protein [unclassified Streptomyces]|uniref:phosphopantetheine-binding protein n=1 Tax=unclassified Streptomyces TaxID=2593676 RepID=UPI0033A7A2C8
MSEVREHLAKIWKNLLKVEQVTDESDFFENGGTSITAVYLAADIQEECRLAVDAIEIVLNPKFGELVTLVRERSAE